jgi:hypothetical protein
VSLSPLTLSSSLLVTAPSSSDAMKSMKLDVLSLAAVVDDDVCLLLLEREILRNTRFKHHIDGNSSFTQNRAGSVLAQDTVVIIMAGVVRVTLDATFRVMQTRHFAETHMTDNRTETEMSQAPGGQSYLLAMHVNNKIFFRLAFTKKKLNDHLPPTHKHTNTQTMNQNVKHAPETHASLTTRFH